jgi:hypothetical protein
MLVLVYSYAPTAAKQVRGMNGRGMISAFITLPFIPLPNQGVGAGAVY